MLDSIKYEFIATLSKLEFNVPPEFESHPIGPELHFQHDEVSSLGQSSQSGELDQSDDEQQKPYVRQTPKVGRNDPCRCGSGKKYKQCCGKIG